MDAEALQNLLTEAEAAGVDVWDEDLVKNTKLKLQFYELLNSIKASVETLKAEEQPFSADPASRLPFEMSLTSLKDILRSLEVNKVPVADELGSGDLIAQASALLPKPPGSAGDASGAG